MANYKHKTIKDKPIIGRWYKFSVAIPPKYEALLFRANFTNEITEWYGYWDGKEFMGAFSPTEPFPERIGQKYVIQWKKLSTIRKRRIAIWKE